MRSVYLVGQWRGARKQWEVQGLFWTEKQAIAACRTKKYFVMPLKFGVKLPHHTSIGTGCWYPLAETKAEGKRRLAAIVGSKP